MDEREARWQQLQETYADYGVVLAIGAGVSKAACMPDWVELLSRIETMCGESADLVRWLLRDGYSLPFVASALHETCTAAGASTDFAELVRAALYRDFPFYCGNLGRDFSGADAADFVRWIEERNATMRAVAALCAMAGDEPGRYRHNPYVIAIVDFNLDSILRTFAQAKYRRRVLRTIERASKDLRLKRIPLYKMHGLLRFESERKQRAAKEAADKLVFTEGEYFDRFNRPTSLFNYTILSLLRERSFLFVGLSMQDDNLRRLLYYSNAERMQALAEEAAGGRASDRVPQQPAEAALATNANDVDDERTLARHFAILRREQTPGVDAARERTLDRLGVRVLWIDNYAEIPARLGQMYERGEGRWVDVYGPTTA